MHMQSEPVHEDRMQAACQRPEEGEESEVLARNSLRAETNAEVEQRWLPSWQTPPTEWRDLAAQRHVVTQRAQAPKGIISPPLSDPLYALTTQRKTP
jgi:hypothetical protein